MPVQHILSIRGQSVPDVIHPILVQSEAVHLVWAIDELLDVLSDVVGQLLEHHFRLVVCEWSHVDAQQVPRGRCLSRRTCPDRQSVYLVFCWIQRVISGKP